jgi:hypothetical protein
MVFTADKRSYNRPSLDRIDNAKGYHIGNVRLIWYMANMAKHMYTDEQLVRFCEYVIEHHKKRGL